jgi:hypothetical protein
MQNSKDKYVQRKKCRDNIYKAKDSMDKYVQRVTKYMIQKSRDKYVQRATNYMIKKSGDKYVQSGGYRKTVLIEKN